MVKYNIIRVDQILVNGHWEEETSIVDTKSDLQEAMDIRDELNIMYERYTHCEKRYYCVSQEIYKQK